MDITGRPGLVYLLQRVINNDNEDGITEEETEIDLIIEDDASNIVRRHQFLPPFVTMQESAPVVVPVGEGSVQGEQEIDIEIQEFENDYELRTNYNILEDNFNNYEPGVLDEEPSEDNDDETDDAVEEQRIMHQLHHHRIPIVGEGDFTLYANGAERHNRPMHYEVNPYNYRNIHGDVDSFHRFSATSHINLIGINRPAPDLVQQHLLQPYPYQPFGYVPFHYHHRAPVNWLETTSTLSRSSQDGGQSQVSVMSNRSNLSERSEQRTAATERISRRKRNLFTSTCSLPMGQSLN